MGVCVKDLTGNGPSVSDLQTLAFPGRENGLDASALMSRMAGILRCRDIESAWAAVVALFREIGFAEVLYGYTPSSRGQNLGSVDDFLVLATLPKCEITELMGNGYHLQSATFQHAISHQGVFSWSMPHSVLPPELGFVQTQAALDFYAGIQFFAGCTVGFQGNRTRGFAALILAAPPQTGQDELDGWLAQIEDTLFVLASLAHRALAALPWPRPTGSLTPRQREVLEWVAEGKTIADIACILGLRPATVEKHLRLSRQCLGVETTAHALIKASFLNQVFVRSP